VKIRQRSYLGTSLLNNRLSFYGNCSISVIYSFWVVGLNCISEFAITYSILFYGYLIGEVPYIFIYMMLSLNIWVKTSVHLWFSSDSF
jgi:hypothetical protein